MIPASVFHSIACCVAILSSFGNSIQQGEIIPTAVCHPERSEGSMPQRRKGAKDSQSLSVALYLGVLVANTDCLNLMSRLKNWGGHVATYVFLCFYCAYVVKLFNR